MIKILIRLIVLMLVARTLPSLAWECDVTIDGPNSVMLDQTITLTATGAPAGGHFSWSRTPNLTPKGSIATLKGFNSCYDNISVSCRYVTPKGNCCTDRKYIWVHPCNVHMLENAPAEVMVGEELFLTASGEPDDGKYEWSVNSGPGLISGNGNSAVFVSDQAGEVDIKVALIPPEGGEPCKAFRSVLVKDPCSVSVTGAFDVVIGNTTTLKAEGIPAGGSYEWIYADGLIPMNTEALFTGNAPGPTTLTVQYTTPKGQTCRGSHTVTAYKIENIMPKPACFDSGTTINRLDFQLLTSPPGYEERITFEPETVSTLLQTQKVEVIGSIVDGDMDDVVTDITVVNSDVKSTKSITVNIPDVMSDALNTLGFSDEIKFNFVHSYTSFAECCDHGADTSTFGNTALNVG